MLNGGLVVMWAFHCTCKGTSGTKTYKAEYDVMALGGLCRFAAVSVAALHVACAESGLSQVPAVRGILRFDFIPVAALWVWSNTTCLFYVLRAKILRNDESGQVGQN